MANENKDPQQTPQAGAGGGAGGGDPQPQGSFLDGLNDDLRGYAELKGFKDKEAVLTAYRELEKFQGVPAERLLKLPDENDKEAVNAFLERLGRPKKAEEYKITIPDGQSDKLAKAMAPLFFDAGLSQKQVEKLVAGWNTMQEAEAKAIIQKQNEYIAAQETELKNEWGGRYNENLELAKRAMRALNVTEEQINAIERGTDFKTTMNLFLNIAGKLSEDSLRGVGASNNNNALTPQAAEAKLQELEKDENWKAKFNAGDKEALEEFKRLTVIASKIPE